MKKSFWVVVRFLIIKVILIGLILIYARVIEPNWIEVKEQPVYISKLPAPFEGFRIIHISDLHGKTFFGKGIARRVNKLNPDMVAITGDVFDQTEQTPIDYVDAVFKGLDAKFGVYFVFGNNDTYLDKRLVKEVLARINIKTLINERVDLTLKGKTVDLIGLDDPYSQTADLSKALEGAGAEPKILLVHTPEMVHVAAKEGIDLTLAGHTHGGQILIPFIPRLVTNVSKGYEQYLAGLYKVGNSQMYVNRGLGENDIHMRFFSRPEITVLTLKKQ